LLCFFYAFIVSRLHVYYDNINNHDKAQDYTADGKNFQHVRNTVRLMAMSKMLIYLQISAYLKPEKPLVNLRVK